MQDSVYFKSSFKLYFFIYYSWRLSIITINALTFSVTKKEKNT